MPGKYPCKRCDKQFDKKSNKDRHQDDHVIEILCGPDKIALKKDENEHYVCPFCSEPLQAVRSTRDHLNKHGVKVTCKYSPTLDMNTNTQEDDVDLGQEDDIDLDQDNNMNDSGASERFGFQDITNHIEPDGNTESRNGKRERPDATMSYETAMLASSDSVSAQGREKKLRVALAESAGHQPILYTGYEGEEHPLLTSRNGLNLLLQKNDGKWTAPSRSELVTQHIHTADPIPLEQLKQFGPASTHLRTIEFKELDQEVVNAINGDWVINQKTPHFFSQAFVGSLLINESSALLIHCVEPYARQQSIDIHAERQLAGYDSSYPEGTCKYKYVQAFTISSEQNMKLVIGTTTGSILVTSSSRVDVAQNTSMGPFTTNFYPNQQTSIFIDINSLEVAHSLTNDIQQTQPGVAFASIRQLRSKFGYLSTYMRTRASSRMTSPLQLRPCTIWTLNDYDSAQKANSQEKIGSALFQDVAAAVLGNGSSAVLSRELVKKRRDELSKECAVAKILDAILSLFSESNYMEIIGNKELNTQLTMLANVVSRKNPQVNAVRIAEVNNKLYNK